MKTKSSRRTSAMTSLSDGSSLAPILREELLSAWKSPHHWLRVGVNGLIGVIGHKRYVATTMVATRPLASASRPMERDGGRLLSRCCLKDVRQWLAVPFFR